MFSFKWKFYKNHVMNEFTDFIHPIGFVYACKFYDKIESFDE